MFYAKQIKPVWNADVQERLSHLEQMAKKYNWTAEQFERLKSDYSWSKQDMVDYTFNDTWRDGEPKQKHDINLTYDLEEYGTTALYRFGVDLIHLIALELSKLTGQPFMGDKGPFPHWGTISNGSECLDIVFYDHGGRQQVFSLFMPFCAQTTWRTELGDMGGGEAAEVYTRDGMENGYYQYISLPDPFEKLSLYYVRAMDTTTESGPLHIPARGTIPATTVEKYVRTIAVSIFDKYYNLKRVII
jgi:hypothetical protein